MVSKEQTLEASREFPVTRLARWRLSTGHGVTVREEGHRCLCRVSAAVLSQVQRTWRLGAARACSCCKLIFQDSIK